MTFIDISNRLAVKATCTNRKCNISNFGGPTSGFVKSLCHQLSGHHRLVGVYFMTFIDTPFRLAVKATCTNRKCNISVFGAPLPVLKKNCGLICSSFSFVGSVNVIEAGIMDPYNRSV